MATAAIVQEVPFYHEVNRREMLGVAIVGVVVGIVVPLLGWLIGSTVITPLFCQDQASGMCTSSGMIGYYVSSVLVAIAAVPGLISWGIFRGLLIAIGSTLTLWGLQKYIDPIAGGSWLEYGLISAALFGATYLLFYWLMRLRNFGLSVVLGVGVVVLVRWALLI